MKTLLLLSLGAGLLFAACGGDPKAAPVTPAGPGPAKPTAMANEHGEAKPLGELKVGDHAFAVVQYGSVEPGKEASFDLDFPAGKPLPGTVRAWLGVESGQGSMKTKFAKEGDAKLHGHVETPKPIPEGSRFWVEIEAASGTSKASLAWKP